MSIKEAKARKEFKENLGATALVILTYALEGIMAGVGFGLVFGIVIGM